MSYKPDTQLPLAAFQSIFGQRNLTAEQKALLAAYQALPPMARRALVQDANNGKLDYITGAQVDQARLNFKELGSLDPDPELMRGEFDA